MKIYCLSKLELPSNYGLPDSWENLLQTYDLDFCQDMLGYLSEDLEKAEARGPSVLDKMKCKKQGVDINEYWAAKLEMLRDRKQKLLARIEELKAE